MSKEEIIKEAWGVHYAYDIDENGFRKYSEFDKYHLEQWGNEYFEKSYNEISKEWCVRPKSLSGIETNNGWTKIESESDLPSNDFEYKVGTMVGEKFYLSKGVYEKDEVVRSWYSNKITHYQPIQKLETPIH